MSLVEQLHREHLERRARMAQAAVQDTGLDLKRPKKIKPPPLRIIECAPEPIAEVVTPEVEPVEAPAIDLMEISVDPDEPISCRIYVNDIIKFVAEHYGLRQMELVSSRRTERLSHPRQVAMWLCKEMTMRSLPYIGKRLGGRDHTTVLHGIRKIEHLRDNEPEFRALTDALQDDFLLSH